MKTIKFKNTNGVIVTYQLAGTLLRIAAFIIDVFCYYIAFTLIFLFFNAIFQSELITLILGIGMFFTPLWVEMLTHGQSPGKIIVGISVVSNYGRQCTAVEYFSRYVIKIIEVLISLGLLPIVLISFSERGQSLSDLFAGTTVIIKKKNARFTLKEITDIDTSKTYQVSYPEVKRLKETDVIILKTLLNENKHKQAVKNRKLIDKAALKVSTILQIDQGKLSNTDFLNKIITDYIIATR